MSAILLFATVVVCGFSFIAMRGVMLNLLASYSRKKQFRHDERIYYVILALAVVAHNVVFGAQMVTIPATQWGTDLALTAIVVMVSLVRFMDVYRAMKNQLAEATA